MKRLSDAEFMELLEKQILAGEPSVDPVLTRHPGMSPETAAALHVADVLYVNGDPLAGYNPRLTDDRFVG
jgi:hypothetical protein